MSAPTRPEGERLGARGEGAAVNRLAPQPDDVPSPCISVCEMLPAGVCAGCFRTLDEIALWSVLDAQDKRDVLALLPERRARLAPPG